MSAQAYTNRRRIRAEASVVKVEYKKGVTVNNNAIYATINCLPDFNQRTYVPVCKCPFNGRGTFGPIAPSIPPLVITTIDGGGSGTGIEDVGLWIDGGNALTGGKSIQLWFDGGNAGESSYYDGGGAFAISTSTIDGGDAGNIISIYT